MTTQNRPERLHSLDILRGFNCRILHKKYRTAVRKTKKAETMWDQPF